MFDFRKWHDKYMNENVKGPFISFYEMQLDAFITGKRIGREEALAGHEVCPHGYIDWDDCPDCCH